MPRCWTRHDERAWRCGWVDASSVVLGRCTGAMGLRGFVGCASVVSHDGIVWVIRGLDVRGGQATSPSSSSRALETCGAGRFVGACSHPSIAMTHGRRRCTFASGGSSHRRSISCTGSRFKVAYGTRKALGIWALTHRPPVGDSPSGAERKRPDNASFLWRQILSS